MSKLALTEYRESFKIWFRANKEAKRFLMENPLMALCWCLSLQENSWLLYSSIFDRKRVTSSLE